MTITQNFLSQEEPPPKKDLDPPDSSFFMNREERSSSVFGFDVIVENFELGGTRTVEGPPQKERQTSDGDYSMDGSNRGLDSPTSESSPRKVIDKFFHKNKKIPPNASLIDQHKHSLESNLDDLLSSPKNISYKAESDFKLGKIHKKLANLDDLLNKNPQESFAKREKALTYLDKAIQKLETKIDILEESYKNHKITETKYLAKKTEYQASQGKYHATKAKCFYDMKNIEKAAIECSISLKVDDTNGLAHEMMGHIHAANGDYAYACKEFTKASTIYAKTDPSHYIVSIFYESLIFASLGNLERASFKLSMVLDNKESAINFEDKIFIERMCTSKYPKLINKLAAISQNEQITEEQIIYLKDIASSFDFESLSSTNSSNEILDEKEQELDELQRELQHKTQALKGTKIAHISKESILKVDVSKPDISDLTNSDPYLRAFYKEVKSILNNSYIGIKMVQLGVVENGEVGGIGKTAKGINIVNDLLPVPKAFSVPLKAISLVLETADEHIQNTRRDNFMQFISDEDEMKIFSESIASELTIKLQSARTKAEYNKSSPKDIKKLAQADAISLSKLIINHICNGDIIVQEIEGEDFTDHIKKKVYETLSMVETERQKNETSLKKLPQYTVDIAYNTLEKIKELSHNESHKNWHTNELLEERFIGRLAVNISEYKKIPASVNQEILSKNLASSIYDHGSIINHECKPWAFYNMLKILDKKDALSEIFLLKQSYFRPYISDAYYFYQDEEGLEDRKPSAEELSSDDIGKPSDGIASSTASVSLLTPYELSDGEDEHNTLYPQEELGRNDEQKNLQYERSRGYDSEHKYDSDHDFDEPSCYVSRFNHVPKKVITPDDIKSLIGDVNVNDISIIFDDTPM